MAEPGTDRLWTARLRWRRRGAWQWPAFAAGFAADAVVIHELPFAGDETPGIVGAALLSGFLNLLVVAVLAPLFGRGLSVGHPSLPRFVADDRAGTALVGALFLVLLAAGIAHRPEVRAAEDDFAAQAVAARRFVQAQAPPEFRASAGRLDTWKQGPDLYRTCVPGPARAAGRPRRWWCVFVRTDRSPPRVTRDPDQQSNAKIAGPDNPGRAAP
jgi:hypothetical protein